MKTIERTITIIKGKGYTKQATDLIFEVNMYMKLHVRI